jgi:hypothetical protein
MLTFLYGSSAGFVAHGHRCIPLEFEQLAMGSKQRMSFTSASYQLLPALPVEGAVKNITAHDVLDHRNVLQWGLSRFLNQIADVARLAVSRCTTMSFQV